MQQADAEGVPDGELRHQEAAGADHHAGKCMVLCSGLQGVPQGVTWDSFEEWGTTGIFFLGGDKRCREGEKVTTYSATFLFLPKS